MAKHAGDVERYTNAKWYMEAHRNKAKSQPKETGQSMKYKKNPSHGSREMIAGILTG